MQRIADGNIPGGTMEGITSLLILLAIFGPIWIACCRAEARRGR